MRQDRAQLCLQKLSKFHERHRAVHASFSAAGPFCIATTDSVGALRLYVACPGSAPRLETAFQFQGGMELVPSSLGRVQEQVKWLCTPWKAFEVFPGRPSCILFSLTHSKDILTAELPHNGCLTSDVHVFATLSSEVACFTVADGGAFVLTGDANGGLQTWCAVDGGAICARPGAHSGAVACLAFLGSILAVSGGADGQVMTWIVQAGRLDACQQLHATGAPMRSLAVHASSSHHQTCAKSADQSTPHIRGCSCADGIIAAGTSAGELLAWQLRSGCCSERLFSGTLVPSGGVTALCFSSDGSMLCVGSGQQSGNIWLFSTSSWSSRRLRGGFGAAIVACHFSQTLEQELLVCTTEGLQPVRLRVPMVHEAAVWKTAWHHHFACIQTASGGWTEMLGAVGQTPRELPPVPDFLELYSGDTPGMQGWAAPVPAAAWCGSCAAGNASSSVASVGLSASGPSTAQRASAQPAVCHISNHMHQITPAGVAMGAAKCPAVLHTEAKQVSSDHRQVASAERAIHACEPASVDPAETGELPSPLPPALRALVLQQRHAPTTGATQAVAGAKPLGRAADVARPVSASRQQSHSAPAEPPAQPGDELEHPWDEASSSATSSVLGSRSHSDVSHERHRPLDAESLAAHQPSVTGAASNAVTADCSQDGWPQQRGMPYIPAARVLEASGEDINTKLQTRSLVPHHKVPLGMTVQQVRQLWSQSAACQEEAIARMAKALAIKERLEHLRSAQPPGSRASTAAACSGAKVPGCADIEERARAYAASAANLPKQVHKYHDLVAVKEDEAPMQAERQARKQLRPGWQARRAAKPCLNTAWPMHARKDLSVGAKPKPPVFVFTALGVAEAALRA
ncbi:g6090 [Coccomyxa elongata]